ncbi:ASCH domain-containing protein [Pseudooctadecabacter jejudonensis]|uniref:ASCH domain protein n=1 Tax=Pseudooctadecabacter jejudonensis TaxID=1391910 RepID=A0A1Y5TDZ7_9RHOB|nr:ASCH domain-containing protein [Pseudooctadecabacter jejudonensis]SLN58209.1 ASCH domain protein [Pseudooctadecabacter jejudonensis]
MTGDVWARYPHAIRGEYGDSEALCEHLVDLICAGTKTATCGALRDYEAEGSAIPAPGDIEIVLHWDDTPAAVVEMTDVTVQPFHAVTEDFALAEGENDSHAGWATGHRAYFERTGGWSPDLMLVCQRFKLIEVL